MSSITPALATQLIPSFSLIAAPSLESATASVSPSACFVKNFFKFLPTLESTRVAAAANASVVFSNLLNAFMETIFFAPSIVLNALSSFYAVVHQYTHPPFVSQRTRNATNPRHARATTRTRRGRRPIAPLPQFRRALRAHPYRTNAPRDPSPHARTTHTHTSASSSFFSSFTLNNEYPAGVSNNNNIPAHDNFNAQLEENSHA
mmetsp:Transcript_6566/g.22098  ORF Transcript_6566/g.22098 Transcript_6566/m.22098 type:complete len:204 (-) Transcript_6566:132-743(-)